MNVSCFAGFLKERPSAEIRWLIITLKQGNALAREVADQNQPQAKVAAASRYATRSGAPKSESINAMRSRVELMHSRLYDSTFDAQIASAKNELFKFITECKWIRLELSS